jgi:hypothetical protein
VAGGSRFRVTPAAAPEQPETEQLQNALLVPPMSLAWRGPSGQPTHSLLHFLSVRPLQHRSACAAWQVCCGARGKYPVDHDQQAATTCRQWRRTVERLMWFRG